MALLPSGDWWKLPRLAMVVTDDPWLCPPRIVMQV
jgi:hypothetical protein